MTESEKESVLSKLDYLEGQVVSLRSALAILITSLPPEHRNEVINTVSESISEGIEKSRHDENVSPIYVSGAEKLPDLLKSIQKQFS